MKVEDSSRLAVLGTRTPPVTYDKAVKFRQISVAQLMSGTYFSVSSLLSKEDILRIEFAKVVDIRSEKRYYVGILYFYYFIFHKVLYSYV